MIEGRWKGETVICIASGPSLTEADCEIAQGSGCKIIAVNSSWQRVPKCDVIYAGDHAWWRLYASALLIPAERWTNNRKAAKEYRCGLIPLSGGLHSGLAAIYLAAWFGAARILLLGYDCQATDGQLHWHGAHPRCNNPNATSFRMWQKQHTHVPHHIRSRVVNCSRETALKGYARARLEDVLLPQRVVQCANG
jgi:hypothetical protein